MTPPAKYKKLRVEGDADASGGDNRRATDADGNNAAGDSKSPGVTQPGDETENMDSTKKTK